MNTQDISRTAVTGYLSLVRVPLDAAIGLLPGDPGRAQTRKLALDRADATARALAAAVLRDATLREDAQRRRLATQERERALNLRTQAKQTAQKADERLDEREEQAQERRRQAAEQAKARRAAAARERRERTKQARETEQQRTQASRKVQAKVEERIDEREPQERLAVLEVKEKAQREQEVALAEQAEADRLADAAASIKEERKAQ
jgi:hypothetical protein